MSLVLARIEWRWTQCILSNHARWNRKFHSKSISTYIYLHEAHLDPNIRGMSFEALT